MSDKVNGLPEDQAWQELKLPELLTSGAVREIHATIEKEWDFLQRSACQTAAGRALWKHVVHDPLADLLAGETYLRNLHEKIIKDRLNNAREISGVILAVRTLWVDSRLQDALNSPYGREAQVVLLGADVLEVKTTILQAAKDSAYDPQLIMSKAKSLTRVAADIRESDWMEKLQIAGYLPQKSTVWILEGILYYLTQSQAMQVLRILANKCALTHTVLLADFMNKSSTTLSNSAFKFYSDWPDHLLPSIGFTHVKLSQIGDPDAHFGLLNDPLNLFNKLRSLPRSLQTNPDDGTPCCRLYLVEASGSPEQSAGHKGPISQS
ncbi:uncharacterized protein LOC113865006 isoform X2 [Abrus precatorius]|uniref:Uncharacterized protein LOC113865006 isoform X2 n=1 Tax=Abrus precatorius TaxID=3816 RepID=A0A8B8LFH3_ABRPR|nr:uncharacterized protein LOC113865006 isoform X2 [Abrus precatorius]